MYKLSEEVRDFIRTNPDLQAELAVLNGVATATISNHVSRNTQELTKPGYLWPIAKAMNRDRIPFGDLINELCVPADR